MALKGTYPSSDQCGWLHYKETPLPAIYAAVTASASGATTIAPAPAVGSTIVVIAYSITCGATAVGFNLQSHTTTTLATGVHNLAINGTVTDPYSPAGWFACAPGEALDINLSAAHAVGGELVYVIVPASVE